MAWIESHQALSGHPKVFRLSSSMGWEIDSTIGKLHRFWWWCLDYAPDGDLSKFNDAQIAAAMCVDLAQAGKLKLALVDACWLDREPYFRVHDWWDYSGRFLQVKWKHSKPKWEAVRDKYQNGSNNGSKTHNQPTNLTNQPTGGRLHGIPASVEQVIAAGRECNPQKSEQDCRSFWAHYEGQARTGPSGEVFWITSGEAVVTNWKAKLSSWGENKYANNPKPSRPGADRNKDTANYGKASQYAGVGKVKVPDVPNAGRPAT